MLNFCDYIYLVDQKRKNDKKIKKQKTNQQRGEKKPIQQKLNLKSTSKSKDVSF